MEIEYLRTSRKSYMIVKDADYAFENYELQMILHNEIPNLLEFQVIVGDGLVEYWYDVTGMQPLQKQYTVTPVDERQLRFFLQNLVSMKNAMEEYLLDDHNLSYSLEMVYYDRFAERIRFCYIPGLANQQTSEMKDLFGEILQYLNHSDVAAVRLGYEMYERSTQSEFLVEDCVECLTNHDFKQKSQRASGDSLYDNVDSTGGTNYRDTFLAGESSHRDTFLTGESSHRDAFLTGESNHRDAFLTGEFNHRDAFSSGESNRRDVFLAREDGHWDVNSVGEASRRNVFLKANSNRPDMTLDGNLDKEETAPDMKTDRQGRRFGEKRNRMNEESTKGFWKKKKREKKRRAINYSEILDEEQHNFYAAEEIQGKNYTECFSMEDMETVWKLIYKGDGEEHDIVLTEFPFLLGTDQEKVQGVLQSRTVSRVHARLYLEDGSLFLEDYNSTNGTYINHRLIPMNTPAQLQAGDRVVFATEEFMVSCKRMPKI